MELHDLDPDLLALLNEADEIEKAYQKLSEESFIGFVRGLTIASGRGPKVFETVMADFQRSVFEDLNKSIHQLRDGVQPDCQRWWFERTKKASKDADLAVILMWLLAFPTRPFYAQVGAGDRGQAAIVKERMTHLLHHNPWLNDHVELVSWEVRSKKLMVNGQPMAKLDIMAADIAGAHGGTPDLLIVNELTHVSKWEFVQNLMDNADGVPQGMIIIATNAGMKGSKAEILRNNALNSAMWRVDIWDRPAPWHNRLAVEDAKNREISKSRFNRLWWGKWASGKGDALDEDKLDACFNHPDCKSPHPSANSGWEYVVGLDLGVHSDHAAVAVLGVNYQHKKIRLAYMRSWDPKDSGGEIQLDAVEETCLLLEKAYRPRCLQYDPYQAVLMAQRLGKHMIVQPMTFTAANLNRMADSLVQVVESGQLQLYDDPDGSLRQDFGKLNIVEKSYGYRLEAVRDETGHADKATALIIALPMAIDLMKGVTGLSPDDVVVDLNDDELTAEEQEELPEDLRAIHDMAEEDELESFYKRQPDPLADVL